MSHCQVRSLFISNPEPWGLPHSRLGYLGAPVISTRAPIVVGWLLVPTRLSAPESSGIVWWPPKLVVGACHDLPEFLKWVWYLKMVNLHELTPWDMLMFIGNKWTWGSKPPDFRWYFFRPRFEMVHFRLSGLKFQCPSTWSYLGPTGHRKRPRIGVPEEIAAGLYYPEARDGPWFWWQLSLGHTWSKLVNCAYRIRN